MTLPIDTLHHLLERDLESLKREIDAYPSDESIWATPAGIAELGRFARAPLRRKHPALHRQVSRRVRRYVRDRDAEFARRDVPRAENDRRTGSGAQRAARHVEHHRAGVGPRRFPDTDRWAYVGSEVFLLHLVAHLGYHVGPGRLPPPDHDGRWSDGQYRRRQSPAGKNGLGPELSGGRHRRGWVFRAEPGHESVAKCVVCVPFASASARCSARPSSSR